MLQLRQRQDGDPPRQADFPRQDGLYQLGCPLEGRFVDNGDATVTGNCTGLMWQKETADINGDGTVDPDPRNEADRINFQDALKYCERLDFAAHTDWRLPNLLEIDSIIDHGRFHPAIDPVFGAVDGEYGSSSSLAENWGAAWLANFCGGSVVANSKDRPWVFLRAVRTIQSGE